MYGKFFKSAFTGSMMAAGPEVFAVWAYVIANAVDSCVELNPSLLAAVIGSTPERMEKAIETLCSPDTRSRSANSDGRRLIKDGTFQYFVVNHAKYRNIRSEEDRREYNRIKKREERQRKSDDVKPFVIDSQRQSSVSAHTEADTEAEEKKGASTRLGNASVTPPEAKEEGAAKAAGAKAPSRRASAPDDVAPEVWADWLELRRVKRAPVTLTVLKDAREEAAKAGMSLEAFLKEWCSRGSQGLRADWIKPAGRKSAGDIFDGAI